jgi:hypothetical protein
VLAKLHLAEDASALHLSLQRLEGLIDIVVAYENLHAVHLNNPTVDVPNSEAPGTRAQIVLAQPRRIATDHWVAKNYSMSCWRKLRHETFSPNVQCA